MRLCVLHSAWALGTFHVKCKCTIGLSLLCIQVNYWAIYLCINLYFKHLKLALIGPLFQVHIFLCWATDYNHQWFGQASSYWTINK